MWELDNLIGHQVDDAGESPSPIGGEGLELENGPADVADMGDRQNEVIESAGNWEKEEALMGCTEWDPCTERDLT